MNDTKKWASVQSMVRDMSDKEFADEFDVFVDHAVGRSVGVDGCDAAQDFHATIAEALGGSQDEVEGMSGDAVWDLDAVGEEVSGLLAWLFDFGLRL